MFSLTHEFIKQPVSVSLNLLPSSTSDPSFLPSLGGSDASSTLSHLPGRPGLQFGSQFQSQVSGICSVNQLMGMQAQALVLSEINKRILKSLKSIRETGKSGARREVGYISPNLSLCR